MLADRRDAAPDQTEAWPGDRVAFGGQDRVDVRDAHGESRADAGLAFDADRAVVRFGDPLGDRQPQNLFRFLFPASRFSTPDSFRGEPVRLIKNRY